VKVLCGTFAGLKGVVREVSTSRGMAQVELQLDRRSMAVELELWQLERASER
jgi:transcription antitermination factor NusG